MGLGDIVGTAASRASSPVSVSMTYHYSIMMGFSRLNLKIQARPMGIYLTKWMSGHYHQAPQPPVCNLRWILQLIAAIYWFQYLCTRRIGRRPHQFRSLSHNLSQASLRVSLHMFDRRRVNKTVHLLPFSCRTNHLFSRRANFTISLLLFGRRVHLTVTLPLLNHRVNLTAFLLLFRCRAKLTTLILS